MAKYNIIELNIKDGILIDLNSKSGSEQKALRYCNAIYIYRSTKTKKIYIGQTMHFEDRHKQHYNKVEEKFQEAAFNQVIVIFSKYFNRSALDDVEGQLITYFLSDYSNTRGEKLGLI